MVITSVSFLFVKFRSKFDKHFHSTPYRGRNYKWKFCPFVCPSSLKILFLFLIQNLSSRNKLWKYNYLSTIRGDDSNSFVCDGTLCPLLLKSWLLDMVFVFVNDCLWCKRERDRESHDNGNLYQEWASTSSSSLFSSPSF